MNESDIRKYANLMSELGLTGLEVTENDRVVRLERNPAPQTAAPVQTVQVGDVPQPAAAAEPERPANWYAVKAPMVGTFYAAPAPGEPAFVKVGDEVAANQTLCIVEAMKLMNEIVAETDGQIVEICAQNGQVVDFGCPLFRIK